MSESALALIAIRALLEADARTPQPGTVAPEHVAATDRITIRLRPGDAAAIARRAAERGLKASAYLAALARAHVQGNPPIPARELAALKEGVALLAGFGHVLARLTRNPGLAGPEREGLRRDLERTRTVVAALEQGMHDFVKAALIAWETRYE
jgi:hypothetical protein